ncbi:MAG: DUF1656 domain-containing protein [Gluconacetobacter diazotrophicus]|nr:DUF1656 domain-containing protein [Gluconacetobacter diazotrophicus]
MIPLREIDLLGVFVSPAGLCLVLAIAISAVLRRLLDRTAINRFVWNRALFDLALTLCIGAGLVLGLRFGGS